MAHLPGIILGHSCLTRRHLHRSRRHLERQPLLWLRLFQRIRRLALLLPRGCHYHQPPRPCWSSQGGGGSAARRSAGCQHEAAVLWQWRWAQPIGCGANSGVVLLLSTSHFATSATLAGEARGPTHSFTSGTALTPKTRCYCCWLSPEGRVACLFFNPPCGPRPPTGRCAVCSRCC